MSVMNTYSGRKFDPMKIAPEDVYLEDIAHALSLVCRGGGQIRWFYSVGQHSINCAHEALARGWSDRMALACLLHDASECYISDVIRPVKVHLQNYLEIESMIMDAIWEKFHLDDLTDEENQKWKQIDNEILELELKTLMKGEKDREIIPLSSTPDLSERTFSSVEKEFKELALELFQKLSPEERMFYADYLSTEFATTKFLVEFAKTNKAVLEGLEYRVKSPKSLYNKLYQRVEKSFFDSLADVVR